MQVPLLDLKPQYQSMKDEIMSEISSLCDSQMFILGQKVSQFESELAAYCGSAYACGVTSGSDALIIALMVEGIGHGDEVITSPFTFFATAGAICRVGATPVFADIDPHTFNIDPAQIEKKINSKTKAIIPVHLFGQTADMDPIMALAQKHNLVVIEDACQAIGSEYKNKRAGSIGDYGCFSFFPSKNLGCFGDGGATTTNSEKRDGLLKIFRNHGMDPKYYHKYIGGNFRIDALQAAILSIKLKALDSWHQARQRNAAEYNELFAASGLCGDKVVLPAVADYCTAHIYNQYSILVKDGRRDELRQKLTEAGVGCDIYYPVPLHMQECFKSLGYGKGDMPISEAVAGEIIALPIFPESTSEQRRYVVDSISKALA
ncbi:MAG: DegT/DnrJ/EryC1/StrS family aminotransferase [Victivallales bacterium]|nr:DegT/DnrJ/EryC1/StrS family aminotransferase [Victivallales bacterium]